MSSEEIIALAPSGIFLLGALLCLLFEAAGTPIGARKQGRRTHVALLALGTCGAVLLQAAVTWQLAYEPRRFFFDTVALDHLALFGCAAIAILVALTVAAASSGLAERDAEYGDAYALLLLAGAGLCALVAARELVTVAAASCLVVVPLAALATVDRLAPQGTEAAVKLVKANGFLFALLAFATALRYGAAGDTDLCIEGAAAGSALASVSSTLLVVVLLSWVAAVPLHIVRVDVVHGTPPFLAGLIACAFPLSGAILLVRWLGCGGAMTTATPPLDDLLRVCALLSLVVPPLAALDQSRVNRVVAHLVCAQAGLLLIALLAQGHSGDPGPLLLAVCGLLVGGMGAIVAQAFLEPPGQEGPTWEQWSGAGRRYPLFGLSLVWLWSSLAGLPGTVGFAGRVLVGQSAFKAGEDLLGIAVIVAPVLSAAPVLRLAIFLFAKAPDRDLETLPSGWRSVVVGLACLAALLLGVFPLPLLELASSMRFFGAG